MTLFDKKPTIERLNLFEQKIDNIAQFLCDIKTKEILIEPYFRRNFIAGSADDILKLVARDGIKASCALYESIIDEFIDEFMSDYKPKTHATCST